MNILVVNDDGISAVGIKKLVQGLKKYGHITVCAPNQGRSASSHCIILHGSLSFELDKEEDGISWYTTNGMPADCTRLALSLLETNFDVVFSGINNGLNIGTDILYSGTVSAAREAMISGLPAVAISTDFDAFSIVDEELDSLLEYIFSKQLFSKNYVLNVNFPTKEFPYSKGYQFCHQGTKTFHTRFVKNADGLYENTDEKITYDTNPESDVFLASKGYITFVPLQLEQTHWEVLKQFKK